MSIYCDFLGGCVAGILGLAVGHPLDCIKTRQQVKGITFVKASKFIYNHRGWKGWTPNFSYLFSNNSLKRLFQVSFEEYLSHY